MYEINEHFITSRMFHYLQVTLFLQVLTSINILPDIIIMFFLCFLKVAILKIYLVEFPIIIQVSYTTKVRSQFVLNIIRIHSKNILILL